MRRLSRKALLVTIFALFLSVLTGSVFAIAEKGISSEVKLSLSLIGRETKGITYSLKEITQGDKQLALTFLHQPNDEHVSLIDFSIYNASDANAVEWKDAWMFGERIVGSSCDVKLLLPGENEELRCEQEVGGRDGANIISTFIFDNTRPINLDDAIVRIYLHFAESPEQVSATSALLEFALAGYNH